MLIDADVEAALEAHVAAHPTEEVCGVLLGLAPADGGERVHVQDRIEGRHAEQRGMSVTFTHAAWGYIYETLARRADDLAIVGWYHSHPGFGVFYSEYDAFLQRHFFGAAWQIGVVLDPVSGARGVFRNGLEGIREADCYWRRTNRPDAPPERVECVYRHRLAPGGAGAEEGPDVPNHRRTRIGPRLRGTGLVVLAAGLAATLGVQWRRRLAAPAVPAASKGQETQASARRLGIEPMKQPPEIHSENPTVAPGPPSSPAHEPGAAADAP